MKAELGTLETAVRRRLDTLAREEFLPRFKTGDPTLWTTDTRRHEEIRNRLGWFTVLGPMQREIPRLEKFARRVSGEAFTDVLLLGMGGSSLCPEVLSRSFPRSDYYPKLHVLDSTDPDQIAALESALNPKHTLFIVSSKSGGTTEVQSFLRYFHGKYGHDNNFVAITDGHTLLERQAKEMNFREIFLNPSDIGGRFSALSFFGLVPAALLGLDLPRLLDPPVRVSLNLDEALHLGAVLGESALCGRDKLTLLASPELASFGTWVEQLIAESTGKEGKGIVPIDREPSFPADDYGSDRLFVSLSLSSNRNPDHEALLSQLRAKGHPVVQFELADLYDLGGQFFLWEMATAVAGSILGIDAFNQPNVQESKDLTREILTRYEKTRQLTPQPSAGPDEIRHLVRSLRPGDYFALLAYLPSTAENHESLQAIRKAVSLQSKCATTVGFGPRFLHSTGQLHKGGPNTGVFLQITSEKRASLAVPGEPYDFGTLQMAQAEGDLLALRKCERRAIRIHLENSGAGAWEPLKDWIRGS